MDHVVPSIGLSVNNIKANFDQCILLQIFLFIFTYKHLLIQMKVCVYAYALLCFATRNERLKHMPNNKMYKLERDW